MSTVVSFRMDDDLKESFEKTCSELGMNVTTAITIFAMKMTREKRIPFEVSIDPFYSENNIEDLKNIVKDIENKKIKLVEN